MLNTVGVAEAHETFVRLAHGRSIPQGFALISPLMAYGVGVAELPFPAYSFSAIEMP